MMLTKACRIEFVAILFMIGLTCVATAPSHSVALDDDDEGSNDPFSEELLKIAEEYREWGPVDATASWAPLLCRRPLPSDLHHVEGRFSSSEDHETHGQKIYLLYARDRASYKQTGTKPSPSGQVIVKQSWTPVETTPAHETEEGLTKLKQRLEADGYPLTHQVAIDGKKHEFPVDLFLHQQGTRYHAGELHGLFIMYKTDAQPDKTDNGWVYGTVSADGKTVTSVGKVESCMSCHVDAGEDRLFGLPDIFGRLP